MFSNKTELKAYLAALKELAKNKSMFKGNVYLQNNTFTTTNGNTVATLAATVQGAGEYADRVLDVYALNQNSNLEMFKRSTDSMPELPECEFSEPWEVSEDLAEKLLHAYKYISVDDFRPALKQTVIRNGWVMATDGYRAYASVCKLPEEADTYFSPALMRAYKRLYKYGTWHYETGTDKSGFKIVALYNEHIRLVERQEEAGFPDVIKIMSIEETYDSKVSIPVNTLWKLADKNHQCVRIKETGEIDLGDAYMSDFFATPFKATYDKCSYALPQTFTTREIIMPLVDANTLGLNLALLKDLVDKDGTITLFRVSGKTVPLTVLR